jgi:hypothetical protein
MSSFTVIDKLPLKKIKGREDIKIKYTLCDNHSNTKYCAITWKSLSNLPVVFVYDYEHDNEIMKIGWYLNGSGYIFGNKQYLHRFVFQLLSIPILNMTVDHINNYKLDNRMTNLRLATQSEQNANRPTRSDKLTPCDELKNLGVIALPRHVRWDSTEHKFVIEKHPYLLGEVEQGIRKKAMISGSKSKSMTVVEKYQDILVRLKEMDDKLPPDFEEFKRLREKLKTEYESICRCIREYEGLI